MLETEIKKLRVAVEALTAVMQSAAPAPTESPALEDQEVNPAPAPVADPAPTPEPEPDAPAIDVDELARKCMALSREGRKDDIKAKLSEFGAVRLSQLSGDPLAGFAAWVEAQS